MNALKDSAFLGLCAALFVFAGCKKAETATIEAPVTKLDGDKIVMPANAPQASALSVEAAKAETGGLNHFTGRLVWNDDSTVRVFSPVAGRVGTVSVQVGQRVQPGNVLAKITSPDFGQAQADCRKAETDLKQSERTLERIKELYEHGAAARKDVESAEADYTRASSEKERASARLVLYGGDSRSIDQLFSLKSPIVGVVVEKNVSNGQEVRPDQMMSSVPQFAAPLFVITEPNTLWLQLDVSESEAGSLKAGQKFEVETPIYPGRKFTGEIEFVGDSLDPNTRNVKVRGIVNNADKLLKAEMYVSAQIPTDSTGAKQTVDVSAKAVFLKDNQHFVFIEAGPGQFERRAVTIVGEGQGRVFLEHGVAVGEKVVTEGALLLQGLLDGDKS